MVKKQSDETKDKRDLINDQIYTQIMAMFGTFQRLRLLDPEEKKWKYTFQVNLSIEPAQELVKEVNAAKKDE